MAFLRTWDETGPVGSEDADLIDDEIRNFKTDIRERLCVAFGMSEAQFKADPFIVQSFDFRGVVHGILYGGSTDTKVRNNANSADNLILSDAGNLTILGDISAAGGMTQVIEGFSQSTIPATQAATERTRTVGRWVAPRSGSVLGIYVQVGAGTSATAGTFTATAWKSVIDGFSYHTDSSLYLSTTLSTSNPNVNSAFTTKGTKTFSAGDELFIKYDTDGSWAPTTLTVRSFLLVEF